MPDTIFNVLRVNGPSGAINTFQDALTALNAGKTARLLLSNIGTAEEELGARNTREHGCFIRFGPTFAVLVFHTDRFLSTDTIKALSQHDAVNRVLNFELASQDTANPCRVLYARYRHGNLLPVLNGPRQEAALLFGLAPHALLPEILTENTRTPA